MRKKCAICLRGCIDKIKSGHFSKIEDIYKDGKYINIDSIFKSIKKHIIDCNIDYDFDFFIHCWNPDLKDKLCTLYNPKDSIFEYQTLYKNIITCGMDGQKLGISKSLNIMINFSEREKAWWAIQPIRKKTLNFPANPVDYFIQEKLKSNELQLSPQMFSPIQAKFCHHFGVECGAASMQGLHIYMHCILLV